MKKIINNKAELESVGQKDRWQYYFDDYLVATIQEFSATSDPTIAPFSQDKLRIAPFWQDPLPDIDDQEVKELLDMEASEFKKYMLSDPDFKVTMRSIVWDKLVQASLLLPPEIGLVVKVGYRPLKVQQALFDRVRSHLSIKNPKLNELELYKMTLEFVADPIAFMPPHSTGAAVDVVLEYVKSGTWGQAGDVVDMGSPINYPDDRSWVTYPVSKQGQDNREILREAMLKVGFANLASEWWHYSYGDQYWAIYYNQPKALYDSL